MNGRPWTAIEESILLAGRAADPPVPYRVLAVRLGRNLTALRCRVRRMRAGVTRPVCDPPPLSIRRCLVCGQEFASREPRAIERVCCGCKATTDWLDGIADLSLREHESRPGAAP